MKKILLLISLIFPVFQLRSEGISLANNFKLPGDFKSYFYDSEVTAQVSLNDALLFDAEIIMKENGNFRLLRTVSEYYDVSSDVKAMWLSILQQGLSVGKCKTACPSGLMEVEYRLDNSVLKIYTSEYETSRANSTYLSLHEDTPNGVIMYNDISATTTPSSQSWGGSTTLISSFAGWSHSASFQASGTSGSYNSSRLSELSSQKELQGNFIRLGLFSPNRNTGNVQTSDFGYGSIAGAMWGTSDTLLIRTDSASAWPVYVTGNNQSIAEVWRDGMLIYTQQLQSGVQALDTRKLPGGIYDIAIKIIENGKTVDTQQAQIYKTQNWNNPDRRWRMNLWGGQRRMIGTGNISSQENISFALGGGIDILAHQRVILGVSSMATEKEHRARVRADVTLSSNDTLLTEYSLGKSDNQSNSEIDIRYYRNFPGGSGSLYWRSTTSDVYGQQTTFRRRGDTKGASLSLGLPSSTLLILNAQYMNTAWRKGFGIESTVSRQTMLYDRPVNFKLSVYSRPGFNANQRDNGVSFGVSFSLTPNPQHSVSVETGINQAQGYSNLGYQWRPGEDSSIRSLGGGVSFSPNNTVISGNTSVDTKYVSGDVYAQHSMQGNTNTAGANLSQVLAMGGAQIGVVNGNKGRSMNSVLIVDVDSDDNNPHILASSSGAIDSRLLPGRNIIEVELWKKHVIQFTSDTGEGRVFPEQHSVQMSRGSVQHVKLKAVKTFTLVGMLFDEQGQVLKNRYVKSDVSGGAINPEGVLTLDTGGANRELYVTAENGQEAMLCNLPSEIESNKKIQFIHSIRCRVYNKKEK